jgi:hypothetical protein
MDLLYRALGIAAAVNDTLWRRRINFVPFNLVLAGVAVALFVYYADGWMEATRNGSEPRAVQLSALPALDKTTTFIRTSGTIVPGAGFQYGEQDDAGNMKKVTMEFLPIVDLEAKRGVFVQVSVPHRFTAALQQVELTGMLRPMQPFLDRELTPMNFKYAGVDMLPGFVLVADEAPGNPAAMQLGAAATAAFILVFAVVTVKRNTVFRRQAVPADGAGSQAAAPSGIVRATGTFMLEKHKKRFIDTPAVLGTLDNGDLALFANVDASSNFMGVTYAKREGIWILPIARGSLQAIEEGTMYFGRRARPAVRFTYRDGASDRTRTAIVGVPDGSLRAFTAGLSAGAARA